METEPAKSPSIFISRTTIHYTSSMTENFWLPQADAQRDEGTELAERSSFHHIDYGTYQVVSKAQ